MGPTFATFFLLDGHVITLKDADAANAIFNNFKAPSFICSVD